MLIYQHSLKFVIRWALQSVYFQRKSLVLLIYSSICKFRYVFASYIPVACVE
jgi:hypothetical protein